MSSLAFAAHARLLCGSSVQMVAGLGRWHTSLTAGAVSLQADPENANVYIGNLAAEVTDIVLRQHVAQFGSVLDVKIYRKGGYAFAQVRDTICDL